MQFDVTFLDMVLYEVEPYVNVLGSKVLNRICCDLNSTLRIAVNGNPPYGIVIVSQLSLHPQNL